jgi:hypothetical protein
MTSLAKPTPAKRNLVLRGIWTLFALSLVYVGIMQVWIIHNQPAHITGTRIYAHGAYGIIGAIAEIVLIVGPIVALFLDWRKGAALVALSACYFSVYLFYGPF